MDTQNREFLNLLQWNANSLLNRIHELYLFMNDNHIHVACISETFLVETDNIPSHPDYFIYRLDRQELTNGHRSGGVAIVIHRNIEHQLLGHLNTRLLETIGLELSLQDGSRMQIYSVYLPGGTPNNMIGQHYKHDIRLLTNRTVSFFALGDFNSRHRLWNCTRANSAGNILFNEHQQQQFLIYHPDEPTFYPTQNNYTPSYIDLVLSNGIHQLTDSNTHESSSDHQLVTHKLEINSRHQRRHTKQIPLFRAANWPRYKTIIQNNLGISEIPDLSTITSTTQVDTLISSLTNEMLKAQEMTVPLVTPTPYALNLTPEIKQKINYRNSLKRQSQRPHNINIRPLLRFHINHINKEIQDDVNAIANENFNHMLSTIASDGQNKRLWQTSRFLKNRNRYIPPLKTSTTLAITPAEKSNALADQFIQNHTNPLATHNASFTRHVHSTSTRFVNQQIDTSDINYTNVTEVQECVRRLKNSKAPGIDKIHNSLIKNLPPLAVILLTLIINSCLKLSYFPNEWKHAKVIGIRKPNKPASAPSSYRPISLLSSLSKILERIILSRLNGHLTDNNILPHQQHGFRSQYSTITQLHKLTTHIRDSLSNKLSTGLISIDIEKAFDRVWHEGLIYKLIKTDTPQYLIRIISSFLANRSFQTIVNNQLSSTRLIEFGVPQGAVLSPTLYNIFVHDIPTIQDCHISMFADDTAFYTSSRLCNQIINRLETAVRKFSRYLQRWKIKLNESKTQAIFITNRRTRQIPYDRRFKCGNQEIDWSSHIKYLGVTIDKKLRFGTHIQHSLEKSHKAVRILYSMFNRKSHLSTTNKILLYKVAIRPIFTYAGPIVANIAKTHIRKLQIFQNKTIKTILKVPHRTSTSLIHEDTQIEMVDDFMQHQYAKFQQKLSSIIDNTPQ